MFFHLPLPVLPTAASLLTVFLPLVLFIVIAFFSYRKRLAAVFQRCTAHVQMKASAETAQAYYSPLIDPPSDHPLYQAEIENTGDEYSDDDPMIMADEEEGFLLKSAEHVVEQIQVVVDDIVSGPSPHPANPEELFTKIRAIVSQYPIFKDTEFYDAINNFVAVTIKRDCDLALTPDDLTSLWWLEAA
jgi:hypothetical protein